MAVDISGPGSTLTSSETRKHLLTSFPLSLPTSLPIPRKLLDFFFLPLSLSLLEYFRAMATGEETAKVGEDQEAVDETCVRVGKEGVTRLFSRF